MQITHRTLACLARSSSQLLLQRIRVHGGLVTAISSCVLTCNVSQGVGPQQKLLAGAASVTIALLQRRRPNNMVAELLNNSQRCIMRVLAVRKLGKDSDLWRPEDMQCASMVRAGIGSGSSTGGGVALWVFSDDGANPA